MSASAGQHVVVTKQSPFERAFKCASCGYHVDSAAQDRADADEVRRMLDLVPCPRCGFRSEAAARHRQITILAVGGCISAGLAAGLFQSLPAIAGGHVPASAILAFAVCTTAGFALAALTWHLRRRRLARAAELLPKDTPAASSRRERRWATNDIVRWGAQHPREGSHVFRSEEEMSQVWREHAGEPGAMPQVDFEQHMVAAIFEPEGTHQLARAIQHVIPLQRKLYVIYAKQSRAFPMKNPASLIRVPRAQGKPIFLDVESAEAQELLRFVTD